MPKRINPNLVKIHRNYTAEEAAVLLGVHKNTVRAWIKSGLPVCNTRRPTLILGDELRSYLQAKRQTHKRKCKPFELYCMRCRAPRIPAGKMVDFVALSPSTGRLVGLCPDCEGLINRYASKASLNEIQVHLEVSIPNAIGHISESNSLPVNSDFS